MTEFVDIIADILCPYTKKTHILNRALLKLAIKDDFGDKSPEILSLREWLHLVNHGIKIRLERINLANLPEVLAILEATIKKNQSLLTMAKF